jgi:sialate O-acetylesterase
MEYGGPYDLTFKTANDTVILRDIYVGEVYLFSGQSNMEFRLEESNSSLDVREDSDLLRYVYVPDSPKPFSWQVAKRDTVGAWSALGYLVGREIARAKGICVGIVLCATGASVIESWMPDGSLDAIGIHLSREEKYADHYSEKFGAWNHDGYLYKSKLMRTIPTAFSGVVWYQGESDASEAEGLVYERELCRMIEVWRRSFEDDALPFIVVQIADCLSRIALGPGWGLIQAAQERISTHYPNTYTVICRDICENFEIHPQTKDKLAMRIAECIKEKF